MPYFDDLLALLKTEWEEDRRQFLQLAQNSSVATRRAEGLTWYPIAIRGTELGKGEYLTIDIERTTHTDLPHSMRFGMPAQLFSNHNRSEDRINGTITHQSGNRLRLSIKSDELPEWADAGKLGVDLLFDENSYLEMQTALKQAKQRLEDDQDAQLIRILTGATGPTTTQKYAKQNGPASLNSSQQEAAVKVIDPTELAIIHGPPGTGKTTTLVEAIRLLVQQRKGKILVTAPSNTAVDLLSERLSLQGIKVVRVGNPVRVSATLQSLTLEEQISSHTRNKEIKQLKKRAAEFKNMAHKYKRNFGKAERDQRKALFDEAHRILKEVATWEEYVTTDILERTEVVAATLVGANHYTVRGLKYYAAIIDEAGQALEPACWIPVLKAEKLILAGDHCQLPPTIKSAEAEKKGLANTLLEKNVALHPSSVVLLTEQYRMNSAIMQFSSDQFYQNRLTAHTSVAGQLLFPNDEPFVFIDTAGCGFDEKLDGTSSTNPEEATFACRRLIELTSELKSRNIPDNQFPSLAVISPYKQQVSILKDRIENAQELKIWGKSISVNTIDSFQGQERDIVLISLVRSNAQGEIGFLNDVRRMNVAMTRARKKLIIIGDSSTLSVHPFYNDMVSYSQETGGYHSAWEFTV